MDRLVLICKCHSLEHQVAFWYDRETDELYCEPHLYTYRNFFQRLRLGLKYILGYKSRSGDWDTTIFKEEDLVKLREFLDSRIEGQQDV